MSSLNKVPPELYYLDPSFSLRTARKYQLLDILDSNGVKEYNGETVTDKFTRIKLMHVFKDKILPRKQEIIREYNRKQIEEYLRTDTEDNDNEELSEEDVLSEENNLSEVNDEEAFEEEVSEPEDQENDDDGGSTSFFRISTGKRVGERAPSSNIYPALDDQDSISSAQPHTNISHRKTLRRSNRNKSDEFYSEDADIDYIPENDEDSDSDEEMGEISKDEIYMLKKDQSRPPESYDIPKFHMVTRRQMMASKKEQSLLWMRRLIFLGLSLLLIISSIVISRAYQRSKNGYCQNYINVPESNDTDTFHLSKAPCIPCPDHGICKDGELVCEALYERRTPFYNIRNLLPIADECVHNSVLGRYVGRVERNIKKKLAIHQGNLVCEYQIAHPEYTEEFPVAKLPVNELMEKVRKEEHDRLPEERLDEIMGLALTTVKEDPEIHFNEIDGEGFIGREKYRITLSCRLKKLYHSLSFISKFLILVLSTSILSIYGIIKDYQRSKVYGKQIDKLVKNTINILKQQVQKHSRDKSISPAVPVPQLRSFIVDVNNQRTIKDWEQVRKGIEKNPHIRKSFQEVRGDPVEFWELTT